jgi:DNA adenine methylase
MKKITSGHKKTLFRYFGGKFYLLKDIFKIIEQLYNNKKIVTIVDVFGGSGKVLINIPEDWKVNRVYNDIDHRLFTLLNVLRDDEKRKILFERLNYTLSSRELFYQIKNENPSDDISTAFNLLYLIFYSFNGVMKSYGIMVNDHRSFENQKEQLYSNFKYIKDWRIENLDFRELISKYDSYKTFFYLDPPYIMSGSQYKYSFTMNDFIDLKNILNNVKGYWLMNESERDFEKIKEIFGKPKLTKSYVTFIHNNRSSKKHNTYRLDGFWSNFNIDLD